MRKELGEILMKRNYDNKVLYSYRFNKENKRKKQYKKLKNEEKHRNKEP